MLLGAPDLAALMRAPSPAPFFIGVTGGHVLAVVMSVAVAIAIFNANIAVALMAGRQLYSTGRDGVWSVSLNQAFSAIHPRFKSPWIATLTMGAFTLLWCLAPLRVLVIILAGGTVTVYAGLCLAVLAGRRGGATSHSRFRVPLFPALPLIALIALLGVVWTSLSDADGRLGFLVSGGLLLVSGLLYQGVLKRRGGWAHRGPAAQAP